MHLIPTCIVLLQHTIIPRCHLEITMSSFLVKLKHKTVENNSKTQCGYLSDAGFIRYKTSYMSIIIAY